MASLSFLLDVLYPSRCGLCGLLGDQPICSVCEAGFHRVEPRDQEPAWRGALDDMFRLYRYADRAEQAVRRLKYSRATALAAPMAARLAEAAREHGLSEVDRIIPVPIHWTRQFYRGFNQSQLLCESFPAGRLSVRSLRRIRPTRPQVGLSPEERRRNLLGAFRSAHRFDGQSVLLVDDVITSGHTVGECAKVLKAAGASQVLALSFAGG